MPTEKEIIYSKEMMRTGKFIEIGILLIGIILFFFKHSLFGTFLIALITSDWLFSFFVEKKRCGDYFYSWKCLFNVKSNKTVEGGGYDE